MSSNEPHPETLVRVRDAATGIDTNVAYGYAITADNLEILDEPAQVAFGKARPATRAVSGRRDAKPRTTKATPKNPASTQTVPSGDADTLEGDDQ